MLFHVHVQTTPSSSKTSSVHKDILFDTIASIDPYATYTIHFDYRQKIIEFNRHSASSHVYMIFHVHVQNTPSSSIAIPV